MKIHKYIFLKEFDDYATAVGKCDELIRLRDVIRDINYSLHIICICQ